MVILQTDPVVMLRTDGQVAKGAFRWFLKLMIGQPQTIARVWFSAELLRLYVDKDWINECVLHDNPRKADPFPTGKFKKFVEVTLIKNLKRYLLYTLKENI